MKQSGFTLIELLVTVALIAIIATVGIPNFQSLVSSNRYTADYNEILTHFHYARSEAIKRREDISLTLTGAGGDWSVTVSDGDGSIRSTAGGKGQAQVTPGGSVTFNALGRRGACDFNDDCTVTVAVSGRSGVIAIKPTGRIDQP
ncbi:GspH/FimT family pseudopilin [Halomonas ventosae]|uniref:Type II secretion system protein H n=1 Tax=Halomonas ventosae TaxID=229007 RepID=A0A2T0VF53_9GAMM|nr:GspH/FimT family pseudopilin [Halomonas ventosae]PRY68777.1 type IV fimbrial biogenesis protein FimT [Halomonas ventosae]